MTAINLNDTQLVIINRAIARGNIVGAYDHNSFSCSPRAYTMAITSLIKKGIVETVSGLKGAARDGDYAIEDDRRLYLTTAFLDHYLGEDVRDEVVAKSIKADAKKLKKATPAVEATKSAAKVAAPVETADELDEEAIDDEEVSSSSIVAAPYRQEYAKRREMGGSGQGCNDAVDQWMRAQFMAKVNGKGRERLDVDAMIEFAVSNGLWSEKWDLVNNGQKRMNVANALRRAIAKGQVIRTGKKTLKLAA